MNNVISASILLLFVSVIDCLVFAPQLGSFEISVGGKALKIGPQLSETGRIILYTLDGSGTFHSYSRSSHVPETREIRYSVLKNGILAPYDGPYAINYQQTENGDLVPKPSNKCIYKSDKPAFYIKGSQDVMIPVEIFHSGDRVYYIYRGSLLYTEVIDKPNRSQIITVKVKPDKTCSGDITLFLLKSNGVFARNPPDEYLPNGMKLKYQLQEDGSLSPQLSQKSGGLELTYETAQDGNLNPCDNNSHTLTTTREATKSYILGENGVLAPVSEIMGSNKTVSYFCNGHLVHSSNQFRKIFTNSSVVYLTERDNNMTEISATTPGPKFECHRRKRDIDSRYNSLQNDEFEGKENNPTKNAHQFPYEVNGKPSKSPSTTAFAYDDNGKRIVLEPYICSNGKIALFKLSCKGHMIRLDSHKEPESGFPVYFKMLENCILVPVLKPSSKILLKYTLQPDGSLIPIKDQKCSLKKAAASLVFYMLVKNRELVPVRLLIQKCNQVQVYYQESCIWTIDSEEAKEMELYSNFYSPVWAVFNGKTTMIYSDQISKPKSGSTWSNPNRSGENLDCLSKNLYLIGPNNTKIKIEPMLSGSNGVTIYEMDCNGVCHKSPRDDNKNLGLRSFNLLKDGILLQSNKTCRYVYLTDKQGSMMPCCYPDTKLQAPHGLTVKYLACKNGVLVPIFIEWSDDYLRFSYENHVIYSRRTYTVREILERWGDGLPDKSQDDHKYLKENGCFVLFRKIGDVFYRQPSKKIDNFMVNHTGCLHNDGKGTLHPTVCSVDSKTLDYMEVMLTPESHLNIITCKGKKPRDGDYLLTKDGCLELIEVVKEGDFMKFYKDGHKIGKQRTDCDDMSKSCQMHDPMGLFDDFEPLSKETSPSTQYIPAKHDETKNKPLTEHDIKKCKQIQDCMMQMVQKSPSGNLDIDSNQALTKDIMCMMKLCSKTGKGDLLTRVQRHLITSPST